jgi:rfaE bifunctional protein kinase chain/domain
MKNKLLSIVDKFSNGKILVVGDLILDHYIWGSVDRISPEAPVVVVASHKETYCLGGAANVANNLAALGANVFLCGAIGNDSSGDKFIELLQKEKIDTSGIIKANDRPTTIKTRVIAAVQQVVRIDKESSKILSDDEQEIVIGKIESILSQVNGVILSDYSKGVVGDRLCKMLSEYARVGKFGYGKVPYIIDPKDRNFDIYSGATIVKPNRKEASVASGIQIDSIDSAKRAAKVLLDKWQSESVLITLGADGMLMESGNRFSSFNIPTEAKEVFDVSGAGDTVAAVLSLALAVGATAEEASRLANYAAGIVVSSVGAVAVSLSRLKEVILEGA